MASTPKQEKAIQNKLLVRIRFLQTRVRCVGPVCPLFYVPTAHPRSRVRTSSRSERRRARNPKVTDMRALIAADYEGSILLTKSDQKDGRIEAEGADRDKKHIRIRTSGV